MIKLDLNLFTIEELTPKEGIDLFAYGTILQDYPDQYPDLSSECWQIIKRSIVYSYDSDGHPHQEYDEYYLSYSRDIDERLIYFKPIQWAYLPDNK